MERQQDYVLRTVEERGVRLIRLWFTDVLGQLKSFAITPAELENAFEEGMHFDGSAIDGFSRVQESDVLARPDPNTFELLPWAEPTTTPSARMFCDIVNLDGTPVRGRPPPGAASATSTGPASAGFSFYGRPRDGVLLLRRRRPDEAARSRSTPARYFDLTTADVASDLRKRTHPDARGHGHPRRVLVPRGRPEPARDRPALHRRPHHGRQRDDVPARRAGDRRSSRACYATFMPKPLAGVQGSGMHTHMSLFEGDENAFYEPGDPYGLSKVGRGLHRRPAAPRAARSPPSPTSW